MNHRFIVAVGLLGAVIVGAFSLASVSFYRSHNVAQRDRLTLCRAQNQTNRALRSVLVLAHSAGGARTPDEQARASAFYKKALALVPTLACSSVTH